MNKNYVIGALAVLTVLFAGLYVGTLFGEDERVAGETYEVEHLQQGFSAGDNRQMLVDNKGNSSTTGETVIGALQLDGGAKVLEWDCNTVAFDPTAISSTTVASTTMVLAGAALGDPVYASFGAATSAAQWYVAANVGPAGSSTVSIHALPSEISGDAFNTALNLTTSTLRVCYYGYN